MYLVKIQAETRSSSNVELVAAHLASKLAEIVGAQQPTTRKKPRGGRVSFQMERELDHEEARSVPKQIAAAVEADGYLNGENGGEIRYLEAIVARDNAFVSFCRMDLRP